MVWYHLPYGSGMVPYHTIADQYEKVGRSSFAMNVVIDVTRKMYYFHHGGMVGDCTPHWSKTGVDNPQPHRTFRTAKK